MRPRTLSAVSLIALAIGCASGERGTPGGFNRIDSAGVAIATNGATAEDLETIIVADSVPLLRLGAREGREELLFGRIRGLTRLSDGRIVVGNESPPELRIFNDSGTYLTRLGGRGRGPGEFSYVYGVLRGPGDTISAANVPDWKLLTFTVDGGFVRERSLDRDSVTATLDSLRQVEGIRAWFHDGSVLISARAPSPTGERPERPTGELYRPMSTAVWISSDYAHSRVIGEFGDIQQMRVDLGGGRQSSITPPTSRTRIWHMGTRGDRLCMAENEEPSLDCVDIDGSHLIVRWPQAEVPVTDSVIDAWREEWREWVRSGDGRGFSTPQDMERLLEAAIIPPTRPPVSTVIVDTERRVFVGGPDLETAAPGRASYRVFSADGELLGIAELPRATIREIGDDYVLAVVRDADDVEYVELYRLRRLGTDEER